MTRLSLAGINGANGIGVLSVRVARCTFLGAHSQALGYVGVVSIYDLQQIKVRHGVEICTGPGVGVCARAVDCEWSAGVRVGSTGSTSFYYICPGPQPKGVICLIIV